MYDKFCAEIMMRFCAGFGRRCQGGGCQSVFLQKMLQSRAKKQVFGDYDGGQGAIRVVQCNLSAEHICSDDKIATAVMLAEQRERGHLS